MKFLGEEASANLRKRSGGRAGARVLPRVFFSRCRALFTQEFEI
jgi:hypothetical protein